MRQQFAEYLGAAEGASDRAELALSAGRGCAPTRPARERSAKCFITSVFMFKYFVLKIKYLS